MITPKLISQAPLSEIGRGGPPAMAIAVITPAQLGASFNDATVGNGVTAFSAKIKVSGYNTFMVVQQINLGGTARLELGTYIIADNYTTAIAYDVIIAAAAPPVNRTSFGWITSVRSQDIFDVVDFAVTGGGGIGVTNYFCTIYCGVR